MRKLEFVNNFMEGISAWRLHNLGLPILSKDFGFEALTGLEPSDPADQADLKQIYLMGHGLLIS